MTDFSFYGTRDDSIELVGAIMDRHGLRALWVGDAYRGLEPVGRRDEGAATVDDELRAKISRHPHVVLGGPFTAAAACVKQKGGALRLRLDVGGPVLVFTHSFVKERQDGSVFIEQGRIEHVDWYADGGLWRPPPRELDEAIDAIVETMRSKLVAKVVLESDTWFGPELEDLLSKRALSPRPSVGARSSPDPAFVLARLGHCRNGRRAGPGGFSRPSRPSARWSTRALALHRTYDWSEIVDAFGGEADCTTVCPGALAVFPQATVVSGPPAFRNRRGFYWRAPFDGRGFPRPPEMYRAVGQPPSSFHIFVREAGEELFYAGPSGALGICGDDDDREQFLLSRPLPQSAWVRFRSPPTR